MLFHITHEPNLTMLEPRVPRVNPNIEDTTTPRICFAPSINCCLRGLCITTHYSFDRNRYPQLHNPYNEFNVDHERDLATLEMTYGLSLFELESIHMTDYIEKHIQSFPIYHVYVPLEVQYREFIVPDVFDREYTQEVWLTRPCKTKRVASIMVVSSMDLFKRTFYYTDRETGKRTRGYQMIRDYEYRVLPDHYADSRDYLSKVIERHVGAEEKLPG